MRAVSLARNTFYYQCNAIQRSQPRSLQVKIRAVDDEHKGRYGYRRITATLFSSLGESVNQKCVQRLMQKMGLRALVRAKRSNQYVPAVSDLHVLNVLKCNFFAKAPNEKWATDITEFNVNGQKLYLSACMDLYNGEIIAHRMDRRPVFDLVASTLDMALPRSKDTTGLTVHSDQGWHYKMQPYRAMLAHRGVTQSMIRKVNCFDNAVIESFFSTLKAEYFHLAKLDGLHDLEAGANDYIHYYNYQRIKLRLKELSPVEYRLKNTASSARS